MLKKKANWIVEQNDPNASIIDILLQKRGITTEKAKEQFLYPNLQTITDPSLLNDADKAKERIFTAMDEEEKIFVYGDYDADGVTSTTIMVKALQSLDAHCDYYIPNRFNEGYGLNKEALDYMKDMGASVVITVDNGIADVDEIAYANTIGLDVIVTDHHEIQTTLPNAYALIHPKLSEDYPYKDLAGVGVAFQFAYHLLDYMPVEWLDLVAIGTVADLVPLLEENRVLVTFGLQQLQKTNNIGLQVLKEVANVDDEVTERDIGFMLAPRINAVGRLANASLAVQLLLTENREEAQMIAQEIEMLNRERQAIVETIVEEAERKINDDKVIILYDEHWHEGVLGIAASRLVKKYDRPVFMLTYKHESKELKGSARSIEAFDLFAHCMEIKDLFTAFGGHAQAAGMTIPYENLEAIQQFLNKRIAEALTEDDFKEQISVDVEITPDDMTEQLIQQLEALRPFGMKNDEPIFKVTSIPTQVRQIGQDNKHLKLQLKANHGAVDVIAFSKGYIYPFISNQTPISIVGTLQLNEWNGIKTVQIMLKDIAIEQWQLFDYRGKRNEKYLLPFFKQYDSNLVLVSNNDTVKEFALYDDIQVVTFDTAIDHLPNVECLYLYDLPHDLTVLQAIVEQTKPKAIHLSYDVTEDAFLQSIPNREEFKWLYGYLMKYEPLHLKSDIPNIMKLKKWSKDKTIFMLKVFLDLQFIRVENDLMYVNKDAPKTSLHKSRTYQFQMQQSEIERVLYYSNYKELKTWFSPYMNENREEVTI